jgi:hypothetical protein
MGFDATVTIRTRSLTRIRLYDVFVAVLQTMPSTTGAPDAYHYRW